MEKYHRAVQTVLVLNLVFCALLLQQLFFVAKPEQHGKLKRVKNSGSEGRTEFSNNRPIWNNAAELLGRVNVTELTSGNNMKESLGRNDVTESLGGDDLTESLGGNDVTESLGGNDVTEPSGRNSMQASLGRNDVMESPDGINVTESPDRINVTESPERINVTESSGMINVTESSGRSNVIESTGRSNMTELSGGNDVTGPSDSNDPPMGDIVLKSPQRLRDVVIPFTTGQVSRVFEQFDSWRSFQPCPTVPPKGSLPEGYEFYMANPDVGRNITLTLALSGLDDPGVRKTLLDRFHSLPKATTQCFREVRVVFANLTGSEDSYLSGARNMVEAMMRNDFYLDDPYYVLYIEPDCRPLKRYWLAAMDAMTRPPTADFWIKGSLYRGTSRGVIENEVYARHLNGNAIYRVGDPEFLKFHFDKVVPHPGYRSGYDTDRYQYFADRRDEVLGVRHKFVYSDFIQNMWHYEYSRAQLLAASPYTFITHGGSPKPE
ncbi:hypothetical protein PSACC_02545 [Paramicrosporidium saccamoebae]|uniref:Uncharacterized protein n=1 Tax=Paramicrosporidium saccamoebae TaxID=1246581 RepID=A0A2H9TIT5_9FUNG|nr:hypothetical protein PSACC_02545 [Paramicrosporidium saccamoebae]